MKLVTFVFAAAGVFAISGCAETGTSDGGDAAPRDALEQQERERAAIILRYDADGDGVVTRAEMESGLSAEFAAADADGSGGLNGEERRAVNEQRMQHGQELPVLDWNSDGTVDMNEFSNTTRTMFQRLDKDGNGRLTEGELAAIRFEDASRRSKAPLLIPAPPRKPTGH